MSDKGTALQEKIDKQRKKITSVKLDIERLASKGPGAGVKVVRLREKLEALIAALAKTEADLAAWITRQTSTTKPETSEVQAP